MPVRASQACEACAENHLKCEDQKPCSRCQKKNIRCRIPQKPANESELITVSSEQMDLDPKVSLTTQHGRPPEPNLAGVDNCQSPNPSSPEPRPTHIWVQDQPQEATYAEEQCVADETATLQPDYASFLVPSSVEAFSDALWTYIPSGARTPRGLINFGIETDLQFSTDDISYLNSYNTRIPFEFREPLETVDILDPGIIEEHEGRSGNDGIISIGTQRSCWCFVPVPQDHAYAEHAHLSVPDKVLSSHASPESLVGLDKRTTAERLDLSARDKIMSIVLSQVKPPISRAVSSFPSVELLDSLIQYFLTVPHSGASAWIHSAGFDPKQTRPELLLAMAAAGAVLTPDPSLRKLGFALQEVVRNHIPTVFEDNNTTIRDLQLHQAFMLHLEIGLWSGNSRKIEIAESFQQPLLTMIRRGGMLTRASYPTVTLDPEDGPNFRGKVALMGQAGVC